MHSMGIPAYRRAFCFPVEPARLMATESRCRASTGYFAHSTGSGGEFGWDVVQGCAGAGLETRRRCPQPIQREGQPYEGRHSAAAYVPVSYSSRLLISRSKRTASVRSGST